MKKNIAFIGTGNMGGAIIRAASRSISPEQIIITDYDQDKAQQLSSETGCRTAGNNSEAVREGDYIFLCVKPQVMGDVLREISPLLNQLLGKGEEKVLISIAAGLTIQTLRDKLSGPCRSLPFLRIMPNTPVAIGKGMLALTAEEGTAPEILDNIRQTLSCAGGWSFCRSR